MRHAPPTTPAAEKRYGWYRVYEDFIGHPKWRMVAARAQVHLSFVHTIIEAMFQAAAKARAEGHIGGFDFEVCGAQTDIPPDQVLAVYRVLTEIGWLNQDVIVDWADRNPRDRTANERQRNKRTRDNAHRAVAAGAATAEQFRLLTAEEAAAHERLAELSRVRSEAIERAREEPPLPLPLTAVKGGRG